MVYKKYIKRDGKTFGPYYFKSVRDKNGKVKSVYLGTENPTKSNLPTLSLAVLLVLFFVLGTFGFFAYQGFQVAEIVESLQEERGEDIDVVEEDLGEDIEKEIEIEEIPEVVPDIGEGNESEVPEIEINDSLEINETEVNEIEGSGENITLEIEVDLGDNDVEGNGTEDVNSNQENETIEDVFEEPMFEEDIQAEISLRNLGVIINQPIIWEKNLRLSGSLKDYSVYVPKGAFNVEVYEIVENGEILIFEEAKEDMNLITGNVVFDFFGGLFGFTGNVVLEKEGITLKKAPKEFVIRYSTDGPKANESVIDEYHKKIVVEGEEFEDVLVYSYLDNVPSGSAMVYHAGEKIQITEKDLDEDGFTDYIEWEILKLDGMDEFEIEIVILNVQSYPVVGGNWTVRFNTTGAADLKIRPINGTTWSLENETGIDLQFLDIKCGEESLDYLWVNGSVFVENYSCSNTGHETSAVLTSGKHHLEFDFGGQLGYANNLAVSCGDIISTSGYYTLENGLTDCSGNGLRVTAHNTVLDCAGYTIDGDNIFLDGIDEGDYGIFIAYNINNVTVKDCIVTEFDNGAFNDGDNNTWINNTFSKYHYYGIY